MQISFSPVNLQRQNTQKSNVPHFVGTKKNFEGLVNAVNNAKDEVKIVSREIVEKNRVEKNPTIENINNYLNQVEKREKQQGYDFNNVTDINKGK